jgi:hypothetical protein
MYELVRLTRFLINLKTVWANKSELVQVTRYLILKLTDSLMP